MSYAVSSTPGVYVDHMSLSSMVDRLSRPNSRAALVGFGEYAKHLINLCRDRIVCVYDPCDWKQGIKFRSIPVVGETTRQDINLIIVCEYELVYEFLGRIVRMYPGVSYFIPPTIAHKQTTEINVFEQEQFYQELLRENDEIPISMMNLDKLKLLIEMFRLGLTFPGDVVEMGSWQGGSTWYLAKALTLLRQDRRIFAMDLFETHSMDPTATMCTDEISRCLKRANPGVELLIGLIDSPENLARIPGKLCFAHIDLGPIPKAMEFVWDRLHVGAPLVLDNYGHIHAPTWDFDDFFAARGTRVIRLPWSEQGIVIKI